MTHITRQKLATFFSECDECMLLDYYYDFPEDIRDFYCFEELIKCLNDPNYKNKKEVVQFVRDLNHSRFWDQVECFDFHDFCKLEFGNVYDEVLTVDKVIEVIEKMD